MKCKIILTKEQESLVEANKDNINDIVDFAEFIFNQKGLKKTSPEVKSIKEYFQINGGENKISKPKDINEGSRDPYFYDFSSEQIKYIIDESENNTSITQIAKVLFPDKENIAPLSRESRYVLSAMARHGIESKNVRKKNSVYEYQPPNTMVKALKKINEYTNNKLEEDKLSYKQREAIEDMIRNMMSPRFATIINGYINSNDKNLFESEFVTMTWDKNDLLPEEVGLYMNICKDVVVLENVSIQRNKLNMMIDSMDEDKEFSKNLSTSIQQLDNSYNNLKKSIADLSKKLIGDRAERMKDHQRANSSFLSVIEAWQDEKKREEIIKMAEYQKKLVAEEVERFADMDDLKARVLGLGRDDSI